jgi:PadR family transcriptional regulator, regulatory protein PadR
MMRAPAQPSRPIGEFERAVLLALIKLEGRAYGVSIRDELEMRLDRSVSFGAVYTTLDRLHEKGMVSSYVGEPTPQRGGRAKKFFRIERRGIDALQHARSKSSAVWAISAIPKTK